MDRELSSEEAWRLWHALRGWAKKRKPPQSVIESLPPATIILTATNGVNEEWFRVEVSTHGLAHDDLRALVDLAEEQGCRMSTSSISHGTWSFRKLANPPKEPLPVPSPAEPVRAPRRRRP